MSASDAVVRAYPPGRRLSSTVILHSQAEQRQRRRGWLSVVYDNRFDLGAEVSDIVGPLAEQAAALRYPPAVRGLVADVAGSVAGVLRVVTGLLAESHHLSGDARARVARAVANLAVEQSPPGDPSILDGSWAADLVDQAAVFTADLAQFLGAALPPGAARDLSVSERLEVALRDLDGVALRLARVLPRAAAAQARGMVAEHNERVRVEREAAAQRRALARIGVAS